MIPQLRFPEFEGNLQNRDVLNSFCDINPNTGELPDRFIYIDLESVNKGRLEKEIWISKEGAPSRAQRVLQKGDILYQTVRPYQKNNYFFDNEGDYVASTGYAQIRTNQDEKYFFQYIHTSKFVNNVLKRCTGTSYPAIGTTDLAKVPVSIPTTPEQTKIATFLTAIDKRINLLQKKKTELEQYKKGLMQKLFSQTIRFKDKNGNDFPAWEKKKLGEVCRIKGRIGYRGYTVRDIVSKGNGAIALSPSNIINNKLDFNKCTYVTWEKYEESPEIMINIGDIIFVKTGSSFGKSAYINVLPEKATINPQLVVINDIKTDKKFLSYLFVFDKIQKQIEATVVGGAIPTLSQEVMSNFHIQIPNLPEQKKIANFLSSIDKSIENICNQIDDSILFKQGLLHKMFV